MSDHPQLIGNSTTPAICSDPHPHLKLEPLMLGMEESYSLGILLVLFPGTRRFHFVPGEHLGHVLEEDRAGGAVVALEHLQLLCL